ncbi:MAG: SDR family oxidoreductase [Acidimicrobiales bacterium]
MSGSGRPVSALEGSVALVAGVGDGIGRSCALAFARAGAHVVLGARTASRIEAVAADIEALGRRAVAVPTDITDPAQVERLVGAAAETFGRLDSVVNVAAMAGEPTTIEGLDPDTHRATFEVNVLGPLELSRLALPLLRAAGGGSITLTSTLSTRTLLARLGAYTSTKQAMVTAAQTMAREVGRDGIRVNVVVPGFVRGTDLDDYLDRVAARRGTDRATVEAGLTRESALGILPGPDDIAAAVLFLASPAARCITGVQLDVNAGQWIG